MPYELPPPAAAALKCWPGFPSLACSLQLPPLPPGGSSGSWPGHRSPGSSLVRFYTNLQFFACERYHLPTYRSLFGSSKRCLRKACKSEKHFLLI
uniref:Uncharacterized protein n=1 Tax=Varanus komodoensis TaxID=61221 RepID=A0A8D2JKB7_VARKO